MLVCVKTLVDVPSFEDARNSKEWLTTSETWHYIVQHSPAATMFLWDGGMTYRDDEDKRWDKRWETAKMLKEYLGRASWGVPYQMMYSWIPHTTTKDNAGTSVKFYNIGDIVSFIDRREKEEAERKKRIVKKRKARLLENLNRSAIANKSSSYNEYKIPETIFMHGSFYDPEWFS